MGTKNFPIEEVSGVRVLGRTRMIKGKGLPLFWTASGFTVGCRAGELWAKIQCGFSQYEPWVSLWVNGSQVSRFPLQKGTHWYCLFRGLPPGKKAVLTLLKETQAMSSDSGHSVLVRSLGIPESSGEVSRAFFLPPSKKFRIEFIGDSITTGEGLAGGVSEMDWISAWMALNQNYALLTADALGAEIHVLSQSGWGVVSGWDNDRSCALPPHFGATCSVAHGARNKALGSLRPWDFSAWKADAVVVNLGTNDWNAFSSPAKKNPSGGTWKLSLGPDGKPCADDRKLVMRAVSEFLSDIRRAYPKAHIVWAYGMCGFGMGSLLKSAVASYAKESEDFRVSFVRLPSMEDERDGEKGSRQHPGPGTHRRAAAVLAKKLGELLGAAE